MFFFFFFHKALSCKKNFKKEFKSVFNITKWAWEVDQQWIIRGVKLSSPHLNKKNGLPISFFLEQTKKTLIRFKEKNTHFFFWK